jgi:hypothetical protein
MFMKSGEQNNPGANMQTNKVIWNLSMKRNLAAELVEDARDFKLAGTPAMQDTCWEWRQIIAHKSICQGCDWCDNGTPFEL